MQTFDAALYNLYMDGRITLDEAIRNADSQNNLRLRINLAEKNNSSDEGEEAQEGGGNPFGGPANSGGLSLKMDDEP